MSEYLIKNGHVVDPANKVDSVMDVWVKDGKIEKVGKGISASKAKIIDAKGMIVTPGLIDSHVHLREPGREDKETIETALRAALVGGITSVLAMPNTDPVADDQTVLEYQLSKARRLNLANLFVSGTITSGQNRLSEMWELRETGAVALTDDGNDVQSAGLMRHAFEWAKTFDIPLFCHSEDISLSGDGVMHEGTVSLGLGLPGISYSAEEMGIVKAIMLAEEVGHRVHISHIATKGGVEAVRQAKKRGVKVTAEATPHHFSLTHEECRDWNTNAKMYPPLREESDRKAIIKGLADGTIDTIGTDHAPHLENEKYMSFYDAPRGTVGLETLFGAAMTYLVRAKAMTLSQVVEKLTVAPAHLLRIKKGTLSKGADADISIFDPDEKWVVDVTKFESKGKNSAFAGKTLHGKTVHVLVGGKLKVKNGSLL